MTATVALSELMVSRGGSIDPAKFPEETFDLYSIPSFDRGRSDAVTGAEIGSSKQVIRPNDVLLSKIVPHIRRSWVVAPSRGMRLIGSGEWIIFRSERADPAYLRHVLTGDPFHSKFMATVSGVGGSLLRARPAFVGQIEIPLPPIQEQRRVAAILDHADALRVKRREALTHLDTLSQSIFLDMFGEPRSNPKGFPKKLFGEVASTRLGKMLDAAQQNGRDQRTYLRNANVQWFHFDLGSLSKMDIDERSRKILRLEPGDLLICEGGEPGRAAIWRGEVEECYFQKALHRARPNLCIAEPIYLAWFLWFAAHRGLLKDYVTAATIAHLTGEKLRILPVPLPPIELQRRFRDRLVAIDQERAAMAYQISDLDAVFASLQERAFSGQL